MNTFSLMVQGCTSDAGKTTLVAALCRILQRRGVRVAPFKPQNMALNAAVTADGGEIGRAQALQAQAAGVEAHSDFNPVLLKPSTDRQAQVIIHGQVAHDLDAMIADAAFDKGTAKLKVVVPAYPRFSNHNDFDPLRLHPEVDFRFVGPGEPIPPADLIVLPGSKAVQADLAWLRAQGWEAAIQRHLRYGGKLIGICGGMQMLGCALHDPTGREGTTQSVPGLGLFDFETTYGKKKLLARVTGLLQLPGRPACKGYEIHLGISSGPALDRPAVVFADGRTDGAQSDDGQIFATYCHGLFDHPQALDALLRWASPDAGGATPIFLQVDPAARREADLNRLADAVEQAIDWTKFERALNP